MVAIYKYTLNSTTTTLDIHRGAKILCVQSQNNNICMWCELDPSEPIEQRTFNLHGTGFTINKLPSDKYIGTAQVSYGEFVFHVYESFKTT